MNDRCLIESHRGVATDAPDNTMSAYRLAAALGYDMIELDMRFTKDDRCVAMHDRTINRFARNPDGSQLSEQIAIADITLDEARRYDYGIWFSEKYKGEPIAVLEDILELAKTEEIPLKFDNVLQLFTDRQMDIFLDTIERLSAEKFATYTVTKPEVAKKILGKFSSAVIHYDGALDDESLAAIAAVVPKDQLIVWQRFPNGYADDWCKVPPADDESCARIGKLARLGMWLLKKPEELREAYERFGAYIIETDGSIRP